MADAIGGNGVRQGLGDVLLADQFDEGLRPIAPGDDDILACAEAALLAVGVGGVGDIGIRDQGSGIRRQSKIYFRSKL